MATTGITWRLVQQAPDDGKRREAIGGERVGEIDLDEVFARGGGPDTLGS